MRGNVRVVIGRRDHQRLAKWAAWDGIDVEVLLGRIIAAERVRRAGRVPELVRGP